MMNKDLLGNNIIHALKKEIKFFNEHKKEGNIVTIPILTLESIVKGYEDLVDDLLDAKMQRDIKHELVSYINKKKQELEIENERLKEKIQHLEQSD